MIRATTASELVQRAAREILAALPGLKRSGRLGTWPDRMEFILSSYQLHAHAGSGGSAFTYDEGTRTISFDATSLSSVHSAVQKFSSELKGLDLDEGRLFSAATNLYVIHELTHIVQNLPHYEIVSKLRLGLGSESLAMLDVTADFNAAWAAANIEWALAGSPQQPSARGFYTVMLLLAYVIGARAFPPNGRPHKIQRFLGLMLGVALNEADMNGLIAPARISDEWKPTVPLFMFNLTKAPHLNAFMTEPKLGLVVSGEFQLANGRATSLWRAVDTQTSGEVLAGLLAALVSIGVIRETHNAQVAGLLRPSA